MFTYGNYNTCIGSSNAITRVLRTFSKFPLTGIKQTCSTRSNLAGASSDLVRSMVKVGRKAAELERVKLQMEIQKERSEIRWKRLENRLKMASKAGGKGGLAKNPKKVKREPDPDDKDDDNFLEDLVTSTETDKGQLSYLTLELGGFMTKGADRKTRLDKRHAKIAAATGKPDEGAVEETEQEKLEREAGELMSQLKKAE